MGALAIFAVFALSTSSTPPPISDPADASPPALLDPAATPPPPPPSTTPPSTPPPTSSKKPSLPPDARPQTKTFEALDPTLIGVLQGAMFCVATGVAIPCALVAPGGFCLALFVPLATGYAATFVADRWGPSRAPAIGPIIAAYVASCGSAAAVVAIVAGYFLSNPNTNPNDPTTSFLALGAGTGVLLAGAVAVPVVYSLTAVDKSPGDDGTDFPGWLSAAHPIDTSTPKSAPSTKAPKMSMRY